jgi:hypothetical protein
MAQSIQAVRIAAAATVLSMIAGWGASAIAGEATPQKATRAVLPTMVVTAPAINRLPTAVVTARAYQRLRIAMITAPATGPAAETQLAARF